MFFSASPRGEAVALGMATSPLQLPLLGGPSSMAPAPAGP